MSEARFAETRRGRTDYERTTTPRPRSKRNISSKMQPRTKEKGIIGKVRRTARAATLFATIGGPAWFMAGAIPQNVSGNHESNSKTEDVQVVSISQGDTNQNSNLSERNRAELDVYTKYSKDRMTGWMSLKNLSPQEKNNLDTKISEMDKVIRENPSFEGMKKVTGNRARDVIEFAKKYNVPPEIALSINLIENGGDEFMRSPAGAMDDMQVMPALLAQKLAERGMHMASFNNLSREGQARLRREIGVENISDMYKLFGDWGLAVWAYHAGQGNVYSALRIYFRDTEGLDIGDITNTRTLEETIKMKNSYLDMIATRSVTKGFNLEKLLSNKAVQNEVTAKLEDETELYAFKTIAASAIINEQLPDIIKMVLEKQTAKADQSRQDAKIVR